MMTATHRCNSSPSGFRFRIATVLTITVVACVSLAIGRMLAEDDVALLICAVYFFPLVLSLCHSHSRPLVLLGLLVVAAWFAAVAILSAALVAFFALVASSVPAMNQIAPLT